MKPRRLIVATQWDLQVFVSQFRWIFFFRVKRESCFCKVLKGYLLPPSLVFWFSYPTMPWFGCALVPSWWPFVNMVYRIMDLYDGSDLSWMILNKCVLKWKFERLHQWCSQEFFRGTCTHTSQLFFFCRRGGGGGGGVGSRGLHPQVIWKFGLGRTFPVFSAEKFAEAKQQFVT